MSIADDENFVYLLGKYTDYVVASNATRNPRAVLNVLSTGNDLVAYIDKLIEGRRGVL